MARGNKRTNPRRSRTGRSNIRATLRNLNRAVLQIPIKLRMPSDPPSLSVMREFTVVKDIRVFYDQKLTETTIYVKTFKEESFIVVGVSSHWNFTKIVLTQRDVFTMWQSAMGMSIDVQQGKQYEVSLISAKVWGPSPQATPREVALRCRFDFGDCKLYVNDVGDGKSRPKCGAHSPFRYWLGAYTANSKSNADTFPLLSIDIDNQFLVTGDDNVKAGNPAQHTNGMMVATIHLTIAARRMDFITQ